MFQVRNITAFILLFFWSCAALAAATVLTVKGGVQVIPPKGIPSELAAGQRVEVGSSIKTNANGETSLRFDDGQLIALASNTSFIISQYKFNAHKPEESSFMGSLLRGGLRAVTGIIGEADKKNVTFKADAATIGIRGTDLMLFSDIKLYIYVLDGAISSTNAGGEMVFDAKNQPTGMVANPDTKAVPALLESFPAEAQAAFRVIQMYPLSDTIRKPNPQDPTCGDRR